VAEGGFGGNSATPERIQKADSPAVLFCGVARFPSDGGAGFLIGGFAQKKFELRSKNTAKIENRNRKPKWGRHEVLNVNADSVLRKHFWGRKPAKGLPAFGGAGGDQGRAGI